MCRPDAVSAGEDGRDAGCLDWGGMADGHGGEGADEEGLDGEGGEGGRGHTLGGREAMKSKCKCKRRVI